MCTFIELNIYLKFNIYTYFVNISVVTYGNNYTYLYTNKDSIN